MEELSASKIPSVKKFYFLEYFSILLKSAEEHKDYENVFEHFKKLKHKYSLGESKYKKITSPPEDNLSERQIRKYQYTFDQVILESATHNLIINSDNKIILTDKGRNLLNILEQHGQHEFNLEMLVLLENHFQAFNYLINTLYRFNKHKSGLLILPIYSPRILGFSKSQVSTTKDIVNYSKKLANKLEEDIYTYLGRHRNLSEPNEEIIRRLINSGLMSRDVQEKFDPKKYNAITKRFRDFWLNYFLKDIYGYKYSLNSFELWIYRAKQLEVLHATEFYPNFNGKIVYPTSVISNNVSSKDFRKVYEYENKSLYVHDPVEDEYNTDKFTDALVTAYFDLRKSYRSYFINLISLREVVCYTLKISEKKFERFLDKIYKLNLAGKLSVKISLEVDKLPEETKASYLKREPVMVDGKYRNIIAIDITK